MGKDLTKVDQTIFICNGGSCKKQCAEENVRELRCALKMAGLHESVHTIKTLCMGQCENAPVMFMEGENIWYKQMKIDQIELLVEQLAGQKNGMNENVLYHRSWDKMKPAKVVIPKTTSEFQIDNDPVFGPVEFIKIYPWEFNTYPLLKECFTGRWQGLKLYTKRYGALSGRFKVDYQDGKAIISDVDSPLSLLFVMRAVKDSTEFQQKISNIKLFRVKDDKLFGLRFSNKAEGVVLEVTWNRNDQLLRHLVNNYARISS